MTGFVSPKAANYARRHEWCAQDLDAEINEQCTGDEDVRESSEVDSDEGNASNKKRKRRKKLKSHLRAESSKKTTGTFFKDLL